MAFLPVLARLPFLVNDIHKKLHRQKKFLAEHIAPVLIPAKNNNDGSLSENDFNKIINYYGLAVPAILAEAFAILQERKLTENERLITTYLAAMTGLFDDFFDLSALPGEQILDKINRGSPVNSGTSSENLFDFFYHSALSLTQEPALLREQLYQVYQDQVKSLDQKNGALTKKETWHITREKGGSSVLFYRAAIFPYASETEKNILYKIGGLIQLTNDIFDVYKDRESGIKTSLMYCTHIKEIREYFIEQLEEVYKIAFRLPVAQKSVQSFLELLSLSFFSRGFVCLDQLAVNEKNSGGKFDLAAYSRSQLICDMDTKKNMLRSAAYHIKICK